MSKEKVIENATTISDKLVQYMDSAEKVIQQYGGDAAELGLNVLRIEAGYNIVTALIWLIVSSVAVFIVLRRILPVIKEKVNDGFEYFITGVLLIVPVIGVAANIGNIVNVWNWIGLFWPEAYAVHKFLM